MQNTNNVIGATVVKGIPGSLFLHQLTTLICGVCNKEGDVVSKMGIFCYSCYLIHMATEKEDSKQKKFS